MEKCNKDCLNCELEKCIHDIEDEKKLFREKTVKPVKKKKKKNREVVVNQKKKKKKNREVVVNHKRGRPKKEREIPYWDEWYAKNKERVKAKSKARYWLKRDEILEKNREWRRNHKDYYKEWRRNHKDYYKEWRRKRKEKEHDNNGESESLIRES